MAFIFRCDRCNIEISAYTHQRYHLKIENKSEDTVKEADLCEDCKNVIELNLIPPPQVVRETPVGTADDELLPF